MYAENEKPENEQSSCFFPLSHPHAAIIEHLPHQKLYDQIHVFCFKYKDLGFVQFPCRSY